MTISNYFSAIFQNPIGSISVIINLILIESLLSIDNAVVLASMVADLPKEKRKKALQYGIIGAYFFRGICLLFAAFLIKIWWFKPLGGIYLLYLTISYFFKNKKNNDPDPIHEEMENKKDKWLYKITVGKIGIFWSTVILVELMDLAFSIDNVVAANAYSNNIILVWTGVFIGILAMRFVAQGFVSLLEKYPFLDQCAYLVIGLLGLKLLLSIYIHFYPCAGFSVFLEGPNECLLSKGEPLSHATHVMALGDQLISLLSILIFVIPLFISYLRKKKISKENRQIN